jgi:peptidoglycan hydrolase-like protein with peptidoglycan-binding domain
MRFDEFKTLLREAGESGLYTIGDSHAVAVATAGGPGWTNLAINGKSSTDAAMLANISKVPKGATVLVSLGANDTRNAISIAIRANKFPAGLPAPEIIADSVANVVTKVQAQGATVIFLLFPNGPGRGLGGNVVPYQDKVRDAIKSAIGSVKVIDITGKPLTDGVHATMGVYKEVANQVKATQAPTKKLGTDSAVPGAVRSKDKAPSAELKKGPPFPAEDREAVRALQKSLEAAGYDTGPTGQDGKFGPYTAAALAAFKKDYKVQGDGQTFDKLAQDTLSKVESGAIAKVEQPTPTSGVAFKGDAKGGVGETGTAKEAVAFFVSKGWTPQQAAGIVGNLQAESGANLRTNAVGDSGKAYGIAQWHPDRQAKFATAFGKDIRQAGFKEQLAFVQWELENSESKAAAKLKGAVTTEQAAWLFDQYYERSSGAHRQKRIDNALALAPKQTTLPTMA